MSVIEMGTDGLDVLRKPDVIIVVEKYALASRLVYRSIDIDAAVPRPLLADQESNARIRAGQRLGGRRHIRRWTIADDGDLDVGDGLPLHARNRRRQGRGTSGRGGDDAGVRRHGRQPAENRVTAALYERSRRYLNFSDSMIFLITGSYCLSPSGEAQ